MIAFEEVRQSCVHLREMTNLRDRADLKMSVVEIPTCTQIRRELGKADVRQKRP